jgi:hypothetical protein
MTGISEEWEYWMPDPEIAELIGGPAAGFDGLGIEESRHGLLDHGFRFGRGNPNFDRTRFAREPPPANRPAVVARVCPGCDRLFQPNRSDRRYCSNDCRPPLHRVRRLPETSACVGCGAEFRPDRADRKYCTRACGAKTASTAAALARAITPAAVRAVAGLRPSEAAARLGVSLRAMRRAMRRAGVPPYRAGRPTNDQRRAG